jgi:hypothetical protein
MFEAPSHTSAPLGAMDAFGETEATPPKRFCTARRRQWRTFRMRRKAMRR